MGFVLKESYRKEKVNKRKKKRVTRRGKWKRKWVGNKRNNVHPLPTFSPSITITISTHTINSTTATSTEAVH